MTVISKPFVLLPSSTGAINGFFRSLILSNSFWHKKQSSLNKLSSFNTKNFTSTSVRCFPTTGAKKNDLINEEEQKRQIKENQSTNQKKVKTTKIPLPNQKANFEGNKHIETFNNSPKSRPDVTSLERIKIKFKILQQQVNALQHNLPLMWNFPTGNHSEIYNQLTDVTSRKDLFRNVIDLIDNIIIPAIKEESLDPNGKHRHQFPLIIENIFQLYSHCIPCQINSLGNDDGEFVSVYEKCAELHNMFISYGYEPSHSQCHTFVSAAAREGKWIEAASIYENHINPDKTGFMPAVEEDDIHTAIVGLYCIARAASITKSRPVESVLNGVVKLTMVSPQNNESFMFAAGTALGHAGEWNEFLNYYKTSYKSSDLNQPFIAALMQACILNERYEEAINLFDALVKTYAIAGEFHWGGGQDRMHPACRDLAMRAYGGVLPLEEKENILNDVPDSKTPALDLFNSVISEGDTKVSIEALTGVVRECENDGRWEDAVDVFTTILDIERRSTLRPDLSPSILLHGGKSFHLFRSDVLSRQKGVKTKKNLTQLASDLGYVVNPVMRTCNANKKFGVSLLCLLLFEMAILEPSTSSHTLYRHLAGKNENVENDSPKVSSCNDGLKLLVPIISSFRNIDDILTTVMVALCGLESPSDATFLYENKHELFPRQICSSFKPSTFKIDFPLPMQSVSDNFKSSNSIYNYSLSQVKPNIYRLQPAWDVIAREINKFTSALNSIEANDEKISVEDAVVLSSILATIIRITSRAAHPEMGIQLAKWAESYSIEVEKENVWTKNVEMVAIVSNNETSKSRFINKKRFQSPLALTDSLLSSLSEAFRKGNDLKASKTITNTYLSHIEHPNEWFLTRHETLKNLVAQRDFSSVTTLFHEILVDHKNPDIFCTVGTSMLSENDFNALIDLYRLSISSECMSEELNVLALNAVTLGKVDRDMAFLDSIIMESCYLLGEKKEVYLATKYWSLKRRLGPYSQRLMLWFDPKTRYLHELQLAIETLEKRSTDRLNPRTNALKYIITYAATFNENPLPEYVTTLPLVPRDKEEWTKLLEKVLQEAKYTRILDEPNTIENLTLALRSLGCFEKCIDIVNDALYRGIRVWQRTIDETLLSAREADLEHLTYDIRPFAND